MFEKVVSGVLSRYLGKYIEGLNEVSLDVGLRSGNVKLSNLAVRLDALNDLQLPLTVLAGFHLPFFSLFSFLSLI